MRAEDTDRTRLLAREAGRWILPHWMERQLDPGSPAWEPDLGVGPLVNVAARDVTPVGTVGSARVATIDPRGLVTPTPGGWSLDWWVGADDRWHLPSREVAVRQSLLDAAPIVDTAMRVPGGDVVQRAWAFSDPSAGPVLALELRNDGRIPSAVALSIRPYGPTGAARVDAIDVDAAGIVVDGRRAVWLPRAASRVATSTWALGDVSRLVLSGEALDTDSARVRCPDGLAQASVVLPLSHRTSFVVLVPLDPDSVGVDAPRPEVVPPADAVARGWASHRSRAGRVVLPDAELTATFEAATSHLLIAGAGARLDGGDVRTAAVVAGALDHLGLHDEVDPIVASIPDGQGPGGRLGGDDPSDHATGAVLLAAGRHWQLGRDDALVDALAGELAAGAHHRPGAGLLARRARPLGARGAAWQLAGASAVASALAAAGQPAAAEAIRASLPDLEATAARVGDLDPVDALDVAWLVGVAAAVEVDALVDAVRSSHLHERAVLGRSGLSPELTARLGSLELRRGDADAVQRLRWLVESAGPTRRWSDAVSPRTGAGCGGAGWSAAATAAFVDLVLDLVVCVPDPAQRTIAVLPAFSPEWLGAGVEAHGVRTPLGVVSFAIRWHGERPALLWEVEPHDADQPLVLTAPALDPSWASAEARGEALLAAPDLTPSTAPEDPGSVTTTRVDLRPRAR